MPSAEPLRETTSPNDLLQETTENVPNEEKMYRKMQGEIVDSCELSLNESPKNHLCPTNEANELVADASPIQSPNEMTEDSNNEEKNCGKEQHLVSQDDNAMSEPAEESSICDDNISGLSTKKANFQQAEVLGVLRKQPIKPCRARKRRCANRKQAKAAPENQPDSISAVNRKRKSTDCLSFEDAMAELLPIKKLRKSRRLEEKRIARGMKAKID